MEYKHYKLVQKIQTLAEVSNANKALYLVQKQQILPKMDSAQSTTMFEKNLDNN